MATESDPWTYQCGKCGKDFKTKAQYLSRDIQFLWWFGWFLKDLLL